MTKVEAIAYDFDGILADSLPVHSLARLAAFESLGLGGIDPQIHHEAHEHGMTPNEIIGWVLRQVGAVVDDADVQNDPFVRQVVSRKREAYRDLAAQGLPVIEGALECIDFAARTWGKLAIATTAEFDAEVAPYIRRYNLEGVFMAVIARGDTPEGMTKPHPFTFLETASRLGYASYPGQVIGIDDHPSGIESANTAGLVSIGLTTSHSREQLCESRHIFSGHSEFINYFTE